jgi:hypothetical protein
MKLMSHAFVIFAIFWSPFVMAEDNAGIFFYGTAPSPTQISALAAGAKTSSVTKDNTTTVRVEWPDVNISINIDSGWNRNVQLSGIRGWIKGFPEKERTSKSVVSFLATLDNTTTCYGSTISPSYDRDGKVVALLKALFGSSGGFFFSHQSFYSASGQRIIGDPGDPTSIGPK